MLNRIVSGNSEEVIRAKVLENTLQNKNLNSRTFYFAQVIDNIDPQNLNRIKCRLPVIDEDYYVNVKKEEGDSKLPWVICMSNRLLNVPEVNSIVLVALFDCKVPHFGRMYFDVFSDFTNTEYFDKLNPEKKLLSNWELVEDIFGITINSKPKSFGEFNGKENINYKVGIRGKGNNKLVLDKDNILLVQNAKDKENESSASITKNIDLNSSDLINITSKKGRKQNYNPVFASPLFEYLSDTNKLLKKIVTLLSTKPALSPSGPCTPTPDAKNLITELKSLSKSFSKFKKDGSSEKISIN